MSKAHQIQRDISEKQKELKNIQSNCKHKKQEIRFLETNEYRWICKECEAITGWPTPDELDKWIGK